MSLANDIVAVKKAVEENWEDIILTADQLEQLISDGIEWLDNVASVESVKTAFKNIQLPSFDLNDPIPAEDLAAAVTQLIDELDPILLDLSNFRNDVSLATLLGVIKDKIPSISNIPGLAGLNSAILMNLVNAAVSDGFSLTLKTLSKERKDIFDESTNTLTKNTTSNVASSVSDESVLEKLLDGLESHFSIFISNNGEQLDSLLTKIGSIINDSDLASIENNVKPIIEQFSTIEEPISTQSLFESLKTFIESEAPNAKNISAAVVTLMEAEIANIVDTLIALLRSEIDENSELCKIYQEIKSTTSIPTFVEVISLIIAIPFCLVTKSITGKKPTLPSSIFQENNENVNLKVYGACQIINSIWHAIEVAPELTDKWKNTKYKRLLLGGGIGFISLTFNIFSQIYSKPQGGAMFKGMSLNIGLWNFQWASRISLSFISTMAKLAGSFAVKVAEDEYVQVKYKDVSKQELDALILDLNKFIISMAPTKNRIKLYNTFNSGAQDFRAELLTKISKIIKAKAVKPEDKAKLEKLKGAIKALEFKFDKLEELNEYVKALDNLSDDQNLDGPDIKRILQGLSDRLQLKTPADFTQINNCYNQIELISIPDDKFFSSYDKKITDFKNLVDQAKSFDNSIQYPYSRIDSSIAPYFEYDAILKKLKDSCVKLRNDNEDTEQRARNKKREQSAPVEKGLDLILPCVQLGSEIMHVVWSIINYHADKKDGDYETMANNFLDILPGVLQSVGSLAVYGINQKSNAANTNNETVGIPMPKFIHGAVALLVFIDQIAYGSISIDISNR